MLGDERHGEHDFCRLDDAYTRAYSFRVELVITSLGWAYTTTEVSQSE